MSTLVVAGMLLAVPAPGQDQTLVVGEAPPTGFELRTLDGELRSLAAVRGEHAVLLVFFRGTW